MSRGLPGPAVGLAQVAYHSATGNYGEAYAGTAGTAASEAWSAMTEGMPGGEVTGALVGIGTEYYLSASFPSLEALLPWSLL